MRPFALIILDGWGFSRQTLGNAILSADTPKMDAIQKKYPGLLLQASGPSVGLAWHEAGNSEVGHLTIGAGRAVFQYPTRISKDIENGNFFENAELTGVMAHVNSNSSRLHLIGLLGSGLVHSRFEHLLALTTMAKRLRVKKVYLHLFGDGKDSGLKESVALIGKLQAHLLQDGVGEIVTVIGRYFSMNRTDTWTLTEEAYKLLTAGRGIPASNVIQMINEQYSQGKTDTDLEAIIINPDAPIRDNDGLIFFNFREDSMRQIVRPFVQPDFHHFPIKTFNNLKIVFMTQYLEGLTSGYSVAFSPHSVKNGLAEIISLSGKKQLHIAEAEKYAHVTYFFNCLRREAFTGEDDILLESASDSAVLLHPEMRTFDIVKNIQKALEKNIYDFLLINIANADILAHQGSLGSAVAGIQIMDAAIGEITGLILNAGGTILITADHGNAESMIYTGSGDIETRHNSNPVPIYLVAKEFEKNVDETSLAKAFHRSQGILSDVAPTILELMGIDKPPEMTGESLLPLLR